jgi:putative PIN family toxin of toxin-antitoxin system
VPARSRFVFDTSAIVSAALLKQSVSRRAFDKALDEGEILVSLETIDELSRVLSREGFARYVTEQERLEFLAVLLREARLVEVDVHIGACRDPQDNKFLELAVSGNARCIVSGDQDLLVLHPFRGVAIVTPRDFVEGALEKAVTSDGGDV